MLNSLGRELRGNCSLEQVLIHLLQYICDTNTKAPTPMLPIIHDMTNSIFIK